MKIYTRTGDKGQTSLFGGARVAKSHARVGAYGTLDELNSWLGLCIAHCSHRDLNQWMIHVQQDLFAVGSWLASPQASENLAKGKEPFPGSRQARTTLNDARIKELEDQIDTWEKELQPMKSFILPGGNPAGASLHVARTICRRAERETVALGESGETVPEIALTYLNRLNDALFVCARVVNHRDNMPETPWL